MKSSKPRSKPLLTASRLWQLTLSLYQQPGVEPCCLQIQHSHG
ncbi:MAG: DUF2390 domain-containing protein, partial [Aeromonas sp.]|nr:DUF2390 domain-containing protein [Aeromonas sp.]